MAETSVVPESERIWTHVTEGKIPVWSYRPKAQGGWLAFKCLKAFLGSLSDEMRNSGLGSVIEVKVGEMMPEEFDGLEEHGGW